jgi:hypothetical protein
MIGSSIPPGKPKLTVTRAAGGEGFELSMRSARCIECPFSEPVKLTTNEAIELMDALSAMLMLGKGNEDGDD